MASELLRLKWNCHQNAFLETLDKFRSESIHTDVTLACGSSYYNVHKFVLASCSSYFEEILGKTRCKFPIIILQDIRSSDLETLLNYMYKGETQIKQEELSELVKAAECLQIKGLTTSSVSENFYKKEQRKRKRLENNEELDVQVKKSSRSNDANVEEDMPKLYVETVETSPIDELMIESPLEEDIFNPVENKDLMDSECLEEDMFNTVEHQDLLKPECLEEYISNPVEHKVLLNSECLDENILKPVERKNLLNSECVDEDLFKPVEQKDLLNSECVDEDIFKPVEQKDLLNSDCLEEELDGDNLLLDPQLLTDLSSSFSEEKLEGRSLFAHKYEGSRQKKFECLHCPYKVNVMALMMSHSRIHTGIKPFKCEFCDYKAAEKQALIMHTRIHKDEKPYKNTYNEYRSVQKNSLAYYLSGKHGKFQANLEN